MDVQVPHSVHSEIQKEGHIQSVSSRLARNNPNSVQVQGSRDTGRTYDARPLHLLLSIPPKMSVSSFMGYLKGKSALMMFDKHANLKYKFGNRHFWAEGYYVSTVGLNEATIRKYIEDQEKHDIALDKLSVKEYEDPFKGSK